jgi:L-fucose isomerase-like protein
MTDKTTFALFFGNRGFFPASLIAAARTEVTDVLTQWGYGVLALDAECTRYGAVETQDEGRIYANFLAENRGRYDGVILVLPNFGDEGGAVTALKDAGVPILVQAYPDDLDKMAPALRRDAFCGKISVMDVFRQNGVKFTALKPHVVSPGSARFKENVEHFAAVCRIVRGVRGMVVGAIGARTTPFKTVRIDEVTLQRHDITVETFDLSDIFARMKAVREDDSAYQAKAGQLYAQASWDAVPAQAFDNLVRLGVTLDWVSEEYHMDALALRCWNEIPQQLGVSPCVLLGVLNDHGLAAACEVDTGSAIAMHALSLASRRPATCLDWNNNYADDDDKCILFHCGPVPASLMAAPGQISDHLILANSIGLGHGFGCNVGRIAPGAFTFGSLMTDGGRIKTYVGQGRFTGDPIPADFFGCAGVAEIAHLQDVLLHVGRQGHRHHVSVTPGDVQAPVVEALSNYLGFDVDVPQNGR